MRKIALTFTMGALAALTLGAGAKETIVKAHRQFEAAMNKNDVKAAKKVVRDNFAANFKMKTAHGEQNLRQFLEQLSAGPPPGAKMVSFHFDIGEIREKGATATANVTVHIAMTAPGKGGKPATSNTAEKDVETWTKAKGVWKMTHMSEIVMPKAHKT